VRVTERFTVERYSHVMHIVSNVEGKLKDGLDALAVLRATFPAGTVSGAPKLRAMEIIDELEPTKRGIYAGSAATSVSTATWTWPSPSAPRWSRTADPRPGRRRHRRRLRPAEWQETQSKARAALRAAEIAEAGLDTRL
jgi:anthranilate synthase component 1